MSLDQKKNINLDNGLALNRLQAIIWSDDGLIHWQIIHI